MYYVYRLQSQSCPSFAYTGYTTDLKRRLAEHSRGQVASTKKYAPFTLVFYSAFKAARAARNFKGYLKSGSGKAFARKRLWPADEGPGSSPTYGL